MLKCDFKRGAVKRALFVDKLKIYFYDGNRSTIILYDPHLSCAYSKFCHNFTQSLGTEEDEEEVVPHLHTSLIHVA
jgi:hypothetical protein